MCRSDDFTGEFYFMCKKEITITSHRRCKEMKKGNTQFYESSISSLPQPQKDITGNKIFRRFLS